MNETILVVETFTTDTVSAVQDVDVYKRQLVGG